MPDDQNVPLGVVHDQRLQTLQYQAVREEHIAQFVFLHRQLSIEQVSRLSTYVFDRLLPSSVFEVAWNGHDHHVQLLRQILRPPGTVLQVNEELVYVCGAAIHDDDPGVVPSLRREAR